MNKYEKLLAIQNELKAPKSQYNNFGKYKFRSCEDILEAVKPLNNKYKATLYLTDKLQQIGDRYYIEATACFIDVESGESIEVTAYAREEQNKKGMDSSQITGASSSYARKYALNGLYNIDDTKDSDVTNNGENKDYRAEFIRLCKQKNIDSVEYAKEHGINKSTTQEQYKQICKKINNS